MNNVLGLLHISRNMIYDILTNEDFSEEDFVQVWTVNHKLLESIGILKKVFRNEHKVVINE